MARLPRLYAPDTPQLIEARFARPLASPSALTPADTLDRLAQWLRESLEGQPLALHGWSLTLDRLLLLATPADAQALPKLVQGFARRYATRLQHGRVFDQRYRSALLQPGRWVVPSLLYIDTLAARLGLAPDATRWPWSSASQHTGTGMQAQAWLAPHMDYWQLGNTPYERQAHYLQQMHSGLSATTTKQIEQALFGQWALGDEAFLAHIGHQATRRLSPRPRGRPRRQATADQPETA